jgi:uncharacterized protein
MMRYFCALMSGAPTDRIDPWRACRRELVFSGEATLSEMPRLGEAIVQFGRGAVEKTTHRGSGDAARGADYTLHFMRDRQGRFVVKGHVRALLRLRCQRCLDEVEIPVDTEISLALIRRDEQALDLPEHLDPWLVADDALSPLEIVEDELLLAIPQVPRHPGSCRRPSGSAEADMSRRDAAPDGARGPFAGLAVLKKQPPDI